MKKETLLSATIFTFTLLFINPFSSADEKVLIRANNEFASRFYKVLSGSTEDNFIFCPLCLSASMAMLSIGGNQKTAEQIQSVMGFPVNESILLDGYKNIIHTFKNQFKPTRLMFNGIFLSKNITLNPLYERKLVKYFQTSPKVLTSGGGGKDDEIEKLIENELDNSLDTSEEQSRNDVHPKDETTTDNDTSFVLANFLKFKAGWEKRFEPSGTTQEPFYVSKDEILHVKMMRQTGHFHIVSIPELESRAIALPYLICDGSTIFHNFTMPNNNNTNNSTQRTKSKKKKACKSGVKDSRLQMIVLLPNDNTGLKILEDKLTSETLLDIPRKFEYKTYLDLSLPSFELTSRQDLFNLTYKIGLESLASPNRNFDRISTSEKLTLTSIFHRVSLTVEEKGSRTKSSHLRGQSPGKNPKLVKIDHPFLAFVHDKKLDVILMVLKVVRPI